jgi:hypothetical protein
MKKYHVFGVGKISNGGINDYLLSFDKPKDAIRYAENVLWGVNLLEFVEIQIVTVTNEGALKLYTYIGEKT